ncbi:MAG: hypothetical protein A2086_07135 [Spirochaetes bacterium GWD1_27_9]|nr:MAG: hypothetical protein A2Z98_13155 [Spirochaetes bacterium GWB1_27_13]OHD25614.1 MAG: hypothetical protein A2Y34_08580 [Spirochaetes bacterium GWC1_27_15]OHD29132.1 MAG: hypothetical protein A2086_07135 [Spirochaetes bacterium GWD1_27_9]
MRFFIFLIIFIFSSNIFFGQTFADDQRFKKNENWKKYISKTKSKLSKEAGSAFEYYRFEGFAPANDFNYIKQDIEKKYKIAKYEYVKIKTKDKLKLDGWFIPVENAKGTIIVLHGYSSDMSFGLSQSKFLLEKGYQILVYNARFWQYSKKPEKFVFSITKEISDVGDVLDYVKTRKDVDPTKIGIFGFSQGGFKTYLSAAKYSDFKVVMVDAGPANRYWFDSNPDILKAIKDKTGEDPTAEEFDVLAQVEKISPRPLLILHGGKDSFVPTFVSESIFEKAKDPKEFKIFENSNHCLGMMQSDKESYINTVSEFLDKYLK